MTSKVLFMHGGYIVASAILRVSGLIYNYISRLSTQHRTICWHKRHLFRSTVLATKRKGVPSRWLNLASCIYLPTDQVIIPRLECKWTIPSLDDFFPFPNRYGPIFPHRRSFLVLRTKATELSPNLLTQLDSRQNIGASDPENKSRLWFASRHHAKEAGGADRSGKWQLAGELGWVGLLAVGFQALRNNLFKKVASWRAGMGRIVVYFSWIDEWMGCLPYVSEHVLACFVKAFEEC